MKYCPYCGAALMRGAISFCTECINNDYRDDLIGAGMVLSGLSPDGRIVEMAEIPSHPFFIATQAHPEFKSRPDEPHPLFNGLVAAALRYQG